MRFDPAELGTGTWHWLEYPSGECTVPTRHVQHTVRKIFGKSYIVGGKQRSAVARCQVNP